MDYGKITSTQGIQLMPNPYKLTVSNPTDEQKAVIAEFDNWLECVYTDPPQYDPTHQYLTQSWSEVNGKAVQSWEIHEYEPEATSEDYENSLESLGVNTDEEENA